jgi:hypothetical protein
VFIATIAACGRNPLPASAQPTAAESESIKTIFEGIGRASRESFEREDWTSFAQLYPAGTFTCWNASGEDHRYGFLSVRPIPDSAGYEIWPIGEYSYGDVDTTNMRATHFMKITYEYSYPSRCEPPVAHRWPELHFYLRRENGVFTLTHYCPSQQGLQRAGSIESYWPMLTLSRARQVADHMSQQERKSWRDMVVADRAPSRAISEISRRYAVWENEAELVLEQLCRTEP